MANGVQLATAYISLNVRTDNIKKQVDSALRGVGGSGRQAGSAIGSNMISAIREHMSGGRAGAIFAPVAVAGVRWAGVAGKAIGSALRTAIVSGLTAGLGAAILGAGAVIAAGLSRLNTLKRAEVQLSLKLPPAEITKVRAAVEEAVRGTPISLDAALQAAPRLVSAGLNTDEIKQYTEAVANLSAATGGLADFSRLDIILSQVRSKTKLTGEELMQLVEAGVDVRGMLKETFGWDDKTLEKNLKNNKVGINELIKAADKLYGKNGGLAKKMGNTFEGAVGNMRASVARLGANILDVIFGSEDGSDPLKGAVDGITAFTDKLNEAGKWVAENKDILRKGFTDTKDAVLGVYNGLKSVVEWFGRLRKTGTEVGNSISSAWDRSTSAIGRATDKVKSTIDTIKTKFTNIFGEVENKFNSIFGENGWFAQQFKKLGELVDKVRDVLGLGPATANAAAPGGTAGSTTPFNPGPKAPAVAAGQAPLGGSTMGLSSVPAMGLDENGNPLQSLSGGPNTGPMKPGALVEPKKVGSDKNLLPETVALKDQLTTQFPEVETVHGYRPPDQTQWGTITEHSSGKAFDMMVPSQLMDPETGKATAEGLAWGDRVMKAALASGASVLWRQTQYDPDGKSYPMPDRGDPTQNHWDHVHVLQGSYANFATGGGIKGPGSGTSDSIPAMLSNGEHVLTAEDVKRMGGQNGVYAFRAALKNGMIPGFAPGGAVDPDQITDMTNNVNDLNAARVIDQKRLQELPEDATDIQRLQAEISASQSQRAWEQASADLPIISSGGTPPDRSIQNNVLDTTDAARLSLAQLNDLRARAAEGDDIPPSQLYAAEAAANQAVRNRVAAIEAQKQQNAPVNFLDEFQRSAGFTPTSAGNTGVAGTSSLSSIIGMGNEVVGGLIDTGASLAQTAVSAGVTAGTLGAGAAAGPAAGAAASYGIQLGASIAKRASSYGFQMASIGADSLIAQLFPFGAPRWMGYDYTGFMPQMGIQNAALTTIEKMGNQAIQQRMNPQGGVVPPLNPNPQGPAPAAPAAPPPEAGPVPFDAGQGLLQQGDPGFVNPDPFNPFQPVPGGGGGSWAKGGAIKVYDEGGVLRPGDLALNASTRPEKILTQKQWDAMGKLTPKGSDGPMVQIGSITGLSPEDVANKIEAKQKLAMMRYAGRP